MRLRWRADDDRGVVSAMAVGCGFALLLFAGMVADGVGVVLRARSEAFSVASAAARAGAQALDESAAVHGDVAINEAEARDAALEYLAARDIDGEVTVESAEITVSVDEVAELHIVPQDVVMTASATVEAQQANPVVPAP